MFCGLFSIRIVPEEFHLMEKFFVFLAPTIFIYECFFVLLIQGPNLLWHWENGRVFKMKNNDGSDISKPLETMYVHLIHWIFVMNKCDAEYGQKIDKLVITRDKIVQRQ